MRKTIPPPRKRIKREAAARCTRFAGGSVSATPGTLSRLWAALRLKRITWPEFRLWFASREARARAGFAGAESAHIETARLMGRRWTVSAVARGEAGLARLGLVDVAGVEAAVDVELDAAAASMCAQLGHDNVAAVIGIPRRHVRWVVRQKKPAPALIGTWLAHIVRSCLAKRARAPWWSQFRAQPDFRGCASAGWIATVFGVDPSRVHGARRRLIEGGLFRRIGTTAKVRQRCGVWLQVRSGPVPAVPETRVVADRRASMSSNATRLKITPSRRLKENPGRRAAPGRFQRRRRQGPPTWHSIRRRDLTDPARRLALHASAVNRGVLGGTVAERDAFFAAIARARRCATVSAGALLRRLVEDPRCRWYPTMADDVEGQHLLRESEAAVLPPLAPEVRPLLGSAPRGEPLQAEADWPLVAGLRRALDQAGIPRHADGFAALMSDVRGRRLLAGWDRARWDRAVAWIDAGAG